LLKFVDLTGRHILEFNVFDFMTIRGIVFLVLEVVDLKFVEMNVLRVATWDSNMLASNGFLGGFYVPSRSSFWDSRHSGSF